MEVQDNSPVPYDSSFGGTTDLQKLHLERSAAFFSVVVELSVELPVLQWIAAGSLGSASSYKKSGPTNILSLSIIVILLCGVGKKIYSCLSLALNTVFCVKANGDYGSKSFPPLLHQIQLFSWNFTAP